MHVHCVLNIRRNVRVYDPRYVLRLIITYSKVKTSMKQGKRYAIHDVNVFDTYSYEHATPTNSADPTVLLPAGTPLTTCGQTFYRQDLSAYTME